MELYLYKILDLDERNQVLHSNLWLRHSWSDLRLVWQPATYDRYNSLTEFYSPTKRANYVTFDAPRRSAHPVVTGY